MPLYEYECAKCGRLTSFLEGMWEVKWPWQRRCEGCGSRRLSRVLSSFAPKASRTRGEMLEELKRRGNVQFAPQAPTPAPTAPAHHCDVHNADGSLKPGAKPPK